MFSVQYSPSAIYSICHTQNTVTVADVRNQIKLKTSNTDLKSSFFTLKFGGTQYLNLILHYSKLAKYQQEYKLDKFHRTINVFSRKPPFVKCLHK